MKTASVRKDRHAEGHFTTGMEQMKQQEMLCSSKKLRFELLAA